MQMTAPGACLKGPSRRRSICGAMPLSGSSVSRIAAGRGTPIEAPAEFPAGRQRPDDSKGLRKISPGARGPLSDARAIEVRFKAMFQGVRPRSPSKSEARPCEPPDAAHMSSGKQALRDDRPEPPGPIASRVLCGISPAANVRPMFSRLARGARAG